MGLLDFLRGNKNVKTKTSKKTVGDYTITTTVTMRRGPDVYEDGPGPDYPMPKDTLRELKVYSESVAHPCGFDFSAVRRHKGNSGEWWLEGANYEKARGALASLLPYEERARSEHPGFPHVVERLLDSSVPYSRGADGNLVPYLSRNTTKKLGTVMVAHFRVTFTEQDAMSSAAIYFNDDGDVMEASVYHYDRWRTGDWSFTAWTPKRTGELTYKGSSFIEPKS